MATALVDQYGGRISSTTLYTTPSQNPNNHRPRARPRAKTFEAITAWQRREMVDVSRVLAAGVPNIDSALTLAGEFAIGDSWHVKSRSSNTKWGKQRDEWINQFWYRDCNQRGKMYDFRTTLKALIRAMKVEADYAIVFDGQDTADSQATGKFQVLKFDRIGTGVGMGSYSKPVSVGSGLEKCNEVGLEDTIGYTTGWGAWSGVYIIDDKASPFDGQRIIDGIIVDANMGVLGYRILGYNNLGQPNYADIPRDRIHFNFSARRWLDQLRGIPELAESIMANMTLDDYDFLIGMAMKLSAALSVTRESTDGNPQRGGRNLVDEDYSNPNGDGSTLTRKSAVEEIFPGIVELATNNRESLKTLSYDRPSMNEQEQIRRIETAVLHKLWPRSLIYPDEFARAGGRATTRQANAIITYDQCCVERSARWMVDRATEFGMRRGFIRQNAAGYDPYEYIFTIPGQFTIDEGNDAKMRLSALGRCTISRGIICEADGYLVEEIEEQREAEIMRTLEAAERISAAHPEWSAKEVALMLDNHEANVSFSEQNVPADEDTPPAGETKNKMP